MVSSVLLAMPAEAAQLQFWRFDPQQNRLEFSTDEDVQPSAQLLANPTRIVVDLPGTTLGQPTINQAEQGTVKAIRIGQFDAQTTRLVIEMAAGYTVDPDAVIIQGHTPTNWIVQLPTPQAIATPRAVANSIDAAPVADAATQVEGIRTTPDGFFIRTSGASPDLTVERSEANQVVLQLQDAAISPAFASQALSLEHFGVIAWEIQQLTIEGLPALQMTLTVPANSRDWRASVSNGSGIIILPPRGVAIADSPSAAEPPLATPTPVADSWPIVVPPPARPSPTRPPQPEPSLPTPSRPSESIPEVPQRAVTVVIDPGHGGGDPGAIGVGGLQEKDVVSAIAYEVATILEASGVRVLLTRADDREIDLDPRVQIAERAEADLFVSIHANSISLDRPDINGLETYYYSTGFRLAQLIHESILRTLNMPDRGVRQARFYVIRNTSMPAVLVETGFVTGAQDAQNFNNPSWRQQMSQAIASGILQYVQQEL
jgi:N-acetylmuramoyl-L-alanine amidase